METMDFAIETIDKLDLRKWIKTSEEKNEINDVDGYRIKLLWRFGCENEYWKWNIDYKNDPHYPARLAIMNIMSKKEQTFFEGDLGDLFNYDTPLSVRNNIINLLSCSSVEQFYDIYFSKYEKLEKLLTKDFIIKVPYPLRERFFCLNCSHYQDELYQIELFSKEKREDMKELCVLIPLADEHEQDGIYYINILPSKSKINIIYSKNWCQYDLLHFYDKVPKVINKYEDSPFWSKKYNEVFSQKEKKIVLTLLSVQKYYLKNTDKNIFLKLIEEVFNNYSVCLPSLLSEIHVMSNMSF